jgi:hypothetical protein
MIFLQHVGLDSESTELLGLPSANKLATSIPVIETGMIQYFFCIKLVFGWDENNVQNVTANLNIKTRPQKPILTKGMISVVNCPIFTFKSWKLPRL